MYIESKNMIPLAPKNNLSDKYDRTVYVDMDGVIADFARAAAEIGFPVPPGDKVNPNDDAMWEKINSLGRDKFFANLNWTPDGKKLWDYVNNNFLNIKILTALGQTDKKDGMTSKGKKTWLHRNIPMLNEKDIIMVPNKHAKRHYARPGDIIIDDTKVVIDGWERKGGIGIHHKTTDDTIRKLEKYV